MQDKHQKHRLETTNSLGAVHKTQDQISTIMTHIPLKGAGERTRSRIDHD